MCQFKEVSLVGIYILTLLSTFTESGRLLPQKYIDDIKKNDDDVSRILDYINNINGGGKHMTYDRLGAFVDKHGNRFTGTQSLEDSIDDMKAQLEQEGFDRVYTETVTVPKWIRGTESATLLQPRQADIYVMGLLKSVSGSVANADVLVVKSFDELYQKRAQAAGKIVVYNQEWIDYLAGYIYRTTGAAHAANVGARAALIKSITDFSIYSPHTGSQKHWSNVTAIPSACITTEDAEMLQRMQDRGDTIKITFQATHQTLDDTTSRNLIAEITGTDFPNEYVMFGGHIDSWDVGVGAMDDGGGILVTRQVLSTIKALGLKPRRTLRLVMWTAEEVGIVGAHEYFNQHKDQVGNMSFAMESDSGTFSPVGFNVHNTSGLARAILEEILERYLSDLNSDKVGIGGLGKADISDWIKHGVPGVSLQTQNDKYFYFHHTEGDRMTVEDPDELDRCSSLFTVTAYVVANLDEKLPREGDYPYGEPTANTSSGQIPFGPVSILGLLIVLMIFK